MEVNNLCKGECQPIETDIKCGNFGNEYRCVLLRWISNDEVEIYYVGMNVKKIVKGFADYKIEYKIINVIMDNIEYIINSENKEFEFDDLLIIDKNS